MSEILLSVELVNVINLDQDLAEIVKCSFGTHLLSQSGNFSCENCEETFCMNCIKKLENPKCQTNALIEKTPLKIKKVLMNLNIKCRNDGCSEIINYSDLYEHEEKKCIKIFQIHEDCGLTIIKSMIMIKNVLKNNFNAISVVFLAKGKKFLKNIIVHQ